MEKKLSRQDRIYRAAAALLTKGRLKVTFAESCTGGMLAAALTGVPGASDVFDGAFVTYAAEAKAQFVHVAKETIEGPGVVSAKCAMEMAKGARAAMGADIAVSVTGVAGPGGGTEKTPVGLIFIGISSKRGTRAYRFLFSGSGNGVRRANRQAATEAAGLLLCGEAKRLCKEQASTCRC